MRAFACLLVGVMAGCGAGDDGGDADDSSEMVDCSVEAPHDEFVAGISKAGLMSKYDFAIMSADPAPPIFGNNSWLLKIQGAGAPVMDATITVDSYMPKHNHHSTVTVEVTPGANPGEYTLDPIYLFMPGVWETTISATSGGVADEAVFKFCLPN